MGVQPSMIPRIFWGLGSGIRWLWLSLRQQIYKMVSISWFTIQEFFGHPNSQTQPVEPEVEFLEFLQDQGAHRTFLLTDEISDIVSRFSLRKPRWFRWIPWTSILCKLLQFTNLNEGHRRGMIPLNQWFPGLGNVVRSLWCTQIHLHHQAIGTGIHWDPPTGFPGPPRGRYPPRAFPQSWGMGWYPHRKTIGKL